MAPHIKLTYFDIEARGEPVRLALSLAGIPFEDERVAFAEWKDLKPKTPFGQLPIITIDKSDVRAQSEAMLRWIGSELAPESGLYPKEHLLDIEEAFGLVVDMRNSWFIYIHMTMAPCLYGHAPELMKTEYGQGLIKNLR